MKPPIFLKSILDFCFICLIFIYVLSLFMGSFIIWTNPRIPIQLYGKPVDDLTPAAIFLLIGTLVTSGLFVYVVYLLRKLVRSFFRNKFFTRLQVSLFNLIGQLIVVNSVAELVLDFLSKLFLEGKMKIGLEFETSYDSFFFKLAIGLFFIYLARLFDNAKNLREENELTV